MFTMHGIDSAEKSKVDEAISLQVTMDTKHQVGLACREVRGYNHMIALGMCDTYRQTTILI